MGRTTALMMRCEQKKLCMVLKLDIPSPRLQPTLSQGCSTIISRSWDMDRVSYSFLERVVFILRRERFYIGKMTAYDDA